MTTRGTPLPGHGEPVTPRLRRAAASALETHARDQRLTAEELRERKALVAAATRNADIDALFTDLPQPHPRFRVETMTVWVVAAGLVWFGVIVTWALADSEHVWWPLGVAAGLFLALMTINGEVVADRVWKLRESELERQREQLRKRPFEESGLRIGKEERRSAATALMVHAAAGLGLAAYQEKYDRLAATRTRGDLRVLLGDLPPPTPELAETVLSRAADRPPAGMFVGVTWLVVFPGPGVAMTATWHHGQWYWLLVWFAALVALIVIQVHRGRAQRAARLARDARAR
ncbi:DUF1707 domain-containing protein [Actinophytocola sp.]|uniref:DUF1707 SHOCT-like domain-containing protein n=1 Tax=Actinophytocola sp. TaxID=1872138 RepID=UPI002D6F0BE6|nr:DUF1707 domain-containing protein [Actinophytocola sp.]HYQ65896.1 DUF1707 domain-containing protein [Actinophytocola sp.]